MLGGPSKMPRVTNIARWSRRFKTGKCDVIQSIDWSPVETYRARPLVICWRRNQLSAVKVSLRQYGTHFGFSVVNEYQMFPGFYLLRKPFYRLRELRLFNHFIRLQTSKKNCWQVQHFSFLLPKIDVHSNDNCLFGRLIQSHPSSNYEVKKRDRQEKRNSVGNAHCNRRPQVVDVTL